MGFFDFIVEVAKGFIPGIEDEDEDEDTTSDVEPTNPENTDESNLPTEIIPNLPNLLDDDIEIEGYIDADLDGKAMGILTNHPGKGADGLDLKGIAYLVDSDGDGKIDAIRLDYRELGASLHTPPKTTELTNINDIINSSSDVKKNLLDRLAICSINNGGQDFTQSIPSQLYSWIESRNYLL